MATEQELQSLLLRLSILLATSLSTLSEPLPPTIISDPSSSSSSEVHKNLSSQILNDVTTLLSALQKACTNLTLALKPNNKLSKGQETAQPGDIQTPTSGLDSASLDAAKAQITDMTSDYIPKLTWLCRKASSEAVVYKYVPKTKEDLRKEKEEREFVNSKGGHIVQHLHSREDEKLEKIVGRGLGVAWSKKVVSVIVEVHEALGDLSEAFMSERTLNVLKKASEARAKVNGSIDPASATAPSTARKAEAYRQRALQATGVVWEVCDVAIKGKLPKDNKAAVNMSWKARTEVLQDALREFKEALEERGEESIDDEIVEDDPLAGLQDMTLSIEEKELAARYEPLLRAGCQLHAKAGMICLGGSSKLSGGEIDLDELEEAGSELSHAVDEIVSSLLYAGELDESDDEDEEDDESEISEAMENFQKATLRLTKAVNAFSTDDTIESMQSKVNALIKDLSKR